MASRPADPGLWVDARAAGMSWDAWIAAHRAACPDCQACADTAAINSLLDMFTGGQDG